MKTLARYALLTTLVCVGACSTTRVLWRPTQANDVPDGTQVRFLARSANEPTFGRAVGWASSTPRLISARGDTIVIPYGARIDVRVQHPDRHTNAGAIIGYVFGTLTILADCGGEKYCGEQDPRALLGSIAGAIIGHFIADDWIRVGWSTQ
jgi:hypothetical protein